MRLGIILVFVLRTISAPLWAQSTAQIHGTVRDSSGSAVPSAEVKATQTDTGVTRSATSGTDGGYRPTALPARLHRSDGLGFVW
jgi:hypothetical protein